MSAPRYAIRDEAKLDGAICGYTACQVTGAEKRLSYCAGCRFAQYCSRDCQKKAWKYHRVVCKKEPVADSESSADEDAESDETLSKFMSWCHKLHKHIFGWACFNAYELKHHPERCATHVFLVKVQRTRRTVVGSGRKARKMFKVVDASLVSREHLAVIRPELMDQIAKSDQELAGREVETRPKTRTFVLCGERLSFWSGAYWDQEEIAARSESKNWKAILQSVTDGKKTYEMVQGNPICTGK